ncbi:phosphatidylglycerophosphatase A family protein [Paraburkholderia silvatlantica]|uniref:Phosphatidylglycerophosphatase n=1 Tax=Paraburkholderia silvatlantica TaxID=321895 RepID=A0A2V4T2Y5_9BURK|nr:phosphatidylglycerophosphatase A [Paraburkholderia silvatlantica]PYE13616.1 phosphatidylglycerophosphatase [Paraburkholderia silvatlantica]TDQ76145.1 phosphatidylglycerophosphatase [Paraburkholderia silvatlantica]
MQTDPTPSPAGQPAPPAGPANNAAASGTLGRATGARRADAPFMLTHPLHIVSLGFGSGLSRLAPGTAGTLFAWAAFEVLNRYLTVTEWGLLIFLGFFAGIWITGFTAKKLGTEDPSAIVWDEIVAFWLVLLMITPVDFEGRLWAFVVFRFFDMVKPPPIRYFDRHFKGGLGIMLDDIVAAFFTLLVIALWRMSV